MALIFAWKLKQHAKDYFCTGGENNRPKTKNYIADARGARKLKPRKLKPRKLKPRILKPRILKPWKLKPRILKPWKLKPAKIKTAKIKTALNLGTVRYMLWTNQHFLLHCKHHFPIQLEKRNYLPWKPVSLIFKILGWFANFSMLLSTGSSILASFVNNLWLISIFFYWITEKCV